MMRLLVILLLPLGFGACSGETGNPSTDSSVATVEAIDGALLQKSWPARMANDEIRGPFEGHPGWRHFFSGDLNLALGAFAQSKHARGMARVHQLLSDLYAQGALLSANATAEAYGVDAVDTDPSEMAYVLGVSAVIRGDFAEAKARFDAVPPDSLVHERSVHWLAAIKDAAAIPELDVLVKISGSLGDVSPGTQPEVQSTPHFEFNERSEKARPMGANDPTALLSHSAWHAAAAKAAAPETDGSVLEQVGYRYAVEKRPEVKQPVLPLDDAWLFCSADLSPADTGFIATASSSGLDAVAEWSDRSPLAAALQSSIQDGRVEPQSVMDAAFALQKQLSATMADIGGGVQDFHRPFAIRARIAVLLAGMIVADANDQYRDAGILRLNALERMHAGGIEPVFALSVAAWDAGNRSPLRPEDILHQFGSSYPALVAAKAPLEALHLRRSRNAAPTTPVH